MRHPARRLVALLTAVTIASSLACLGPPTRVPGSARDFLTYEKPELVWATLSEGGDVRIEQPTVIRDTVYGIVDGLPVVLPVEQVREVRVRKINKVKTAIIPAALAVGLTGVILFVKQDASMAAPPDSSDSYNCRSQSDPMNCM